MWTKAANAAEAGVASMEHLNGISDEDLALAKRNGVVAVFTPFPASVLKSFRGEEAGQKEYQQEIERLRAGLQGRCHHSLRHRRDPRHSRGPPAGPPRDHLDRQLPRRRYAAPGDPSGDDHQRGPPLWSGEGARHDPAPGMAADIIATPGDPLADPPRALKQVHFVMKDGRVVRRP